MPAHPVNNLGTFRERKGGRGTVGSTQLLLGSVQSRLWCIGRLDASLWGAAGAAAVAASQAQRRTDLRGECRVANRQESGLRARLRSLVTDAGWVADVVRPHFPPGTPTFANLRCGAWYVRGEPPYAYFKSTDGHSGGLAFSPTRLNLPLAAAAAAAASGTALLVDSTKHGKRFSDALTRTLPTWAGVINGLVLGGRQGVTLPSATELYPPWLPPSEVDSAACLIAENIARCDPTIAAVIRDALGPVLTRPLLPMYWCQPSSSLARSPPSGRPGVHSSVAEAEWASLPPDLGEGGADFIRIVCINASRRVDDAGDVASSAQGWQYVPGAGDDAEHWASDLVGGPGLTPRMLWANEYALLSSRSDAECDALIRQLRAAQAAEADTTRSAACEWAKRRPAFVFPVPGGVSVSLAPPRGGGTAPCPEVVPLLVLVRPWVEGCGTPPVARATCAEVDTILTLHLPVDKLGMRKQPTLWAGSALPALLEAVDAVRASPARPRVVVSWDGERAAGAAAVVAAAAHLSLDGAGAPDKPTVRAAVSCALIAAGLPSLERWLLKELHCALLSDTS